MQKRGRTQQHLTFNILFQRVSLRHIKYICCSSRSHPRIDNAPYITRKSTGESKSMTKRFTALEMRDKTQSLEKVSSIKQRKKNSLLLLTDSLRDLRSNFLEVKTDSSFFPSSCCLCAMLLLLFAQHSTSRC